uniref:Uncharacterized protein n=1 Tax=Parastrongyloides trichosuri TaxID=131310 RepID=A0A0N4Z0J9_PARTI
MMIHRFLITKPIHSIHISKYLSTYKGSGIPRFDKFLEEKKLAKVNEGKENPLDYNLLGNKKKPKEDVFFYTDRNSGKGYSDYSTTLKIDRPYIWPPLRKLYKYNYYVAIGGMILCLINYDMFI